VVIDFGFDGVVIVNGDMLGPSESKGEHLYFTTQAIIMSGNPGLRFVHQE
jgi:hypothetical protein